jgi:hypothetical protein
MQFKGPLGCLAGAGRVQGRIQGPETLRFRPAMDPHAAGVLIMAIILSAYVVYLLYVRDGF